MLSFLLLFGKQLNSDLLYCACRAGTAHSSSTLSGCFLSFHIPSNLDFLQKRVQLFNVLAQTHHNRMAVRKVKTDSFWKLLMLQSFLHFVLKGFAALTLLLILMVMV